MTGYDTAAYGRQGDKLCNGAFATEAPATGATLTAGAYKLGYQ
jgi:hypothetical protein